MASYAKKGVIAIQGVDYAWEITRLGGVSNSLGDHRGLAVSVSLEPGRTKELIVEFPFEEFEFAPPKSKASFIERLQVCVEAAISEGWVPTKRGKAFIYQPE